MKLFFFSFTVFLLFTSAQGQTKKVLFLGNSYTYVNNLPQMIADVAASMNDTLIFDSNAPGGQTLYGHSIDPISIDKILADNWDFVVLQEQSQLPSFHISQVETEVFPYATYLDSIINSDNPCVETVFYMTWGRKNGDASNCAVWPPVCTYAGMDSLLNLRYRMMADSNDAILSPVGAVWNYIRQNYPLIELYQADESHPSLAGTYAAACSFYTALFRKDPALISFNSGLSASDAADIRNAAKVIVYDSLFSWHIGEYDSLINITCNTTPIENIHNNSELNIFPNPFDLQVTLKTNTIFHNATFMLNNSSGQTVKEIKNLNGQSIILQRDNLPSGLYFYRVTEGQKIFTGKLIIIDK